MSCQPCGGISTADVYLAVDLGASSGRVIAGLWDGRTIRMETIRRFENRTVTRMSGVHWDLPATFEEILQGIAEASSRYGGAIRSISVDSWGVDYGLLDENGELIELPRMYRDSRTAGWMDRMFQRMPRREIYDRTGIQFLGFNTLYQLAAEFDAEPGLRSRAKELLFIPDLIAYWLTGNASIERTVAATSQLLKVGSADWDRELAGVAGIPQHLLRPVIEPARKIGALLDSVRDATGLGRNVSVVACAAHDTASAVLGVPATERNPLFLSSGTWSLIGRELDAPIVTDQACAESFSNEHGIHGTTRFLKNVSGMWLIEECLRIWRGEGEAIPLGPLLDAAARLEPEMRLDPNDKAFIHPRNMPLAIADSLAATSQRPPSSHAEMVAVVLHSLADCYADMTDRLREMTGPLPDILHIVGGGSQNRLLNQLTANATGLCVLAGSAEATAAGNILAQILAAGEIDTVTQGREILRTSIPPVVFEPTSATQ